MAYDIQNWEDGAGGGTPLSAARLDHMETGIDQAHILAEAAGIGTFAHVVEMEDMTGVPDGAVRLLRGYNAPADGGGQFVYRSAASTATRNGGDVFTSDDGGRFLSLTIGETYKNVRQFGAKGNRTQDDIPAINAAIAKVSGDGEGGTVYVPKGQYECRTPLVPNHYVTLKGEGHASTLVSVSPVNTLCDVSDKVVFGMNNIRLKAEASTATVLRISHSFGGQFHNVYIHGTNEVSAKPNQTGILLENNAGDNHFTNCQIANLGTGVITRCIQNYMTSCQILGSIRGVWADTGNSLLGQYQAGLVYTDGTIAGSTHGNAANRTVCGVQSDLQARMLNFTNIWMEGMDHNFILGDPPGTNGGPLNFKLNGAFLACRLKNIEINAGLNYDLGNIWFGTEPDTDNATNSVGPELSINATNAPNGRAIGLFTEVAGHFEISTGIFPAGWVYFLRSSRDFG